MRVLIENFKKECERIENGGDFSQTPMVFRVPDLNMIAVRKNPLNLASVPKEYMNEELVKEAVSRNGEMLRYVPLELMTLELCELALENEPSSFANFPEKFKTREMCEKAVDKYAPNIREVPYVMTTRELAEKAVKANGNLLNAMSINCFVDREMCMLAAEHGADISVIPRKYRDYDMFLTVAKHNELFMPYGDVPRKFFTDELWIEATKSNSNNFKFFPRKVLTYELCLEIVRNSRSEHSPFLGMPAAFRTPEMLEAAIVNGKCKHPLKGLTASVISRMLNQELAQMLVDLDAFNIPALPKKFQTEKMWLDFLENYVEDENSIGLKVYATDIPLVLRTAKLCAAILKKLPVYDGAVIPQSARSKEVCLLFARHMQIPYDRTKIPAFVPSQVIDRELYDQIAEIVSDNEKAAKAWRNKAVKLGVITR